LIAYSECPGESIAPGGLTSRLAQVFLDVAPI